MTPIMNKLRRSVRPLGLIAIFVFIVASLGFTTPAQAAAQVQPVASIASVQTALVTTPERVMIPQNPNATLVADPYVADRWGGKWGGTCRYDAVYRDRGVWRYYEVRQNNYSGKRCMRTGYYVESSSTYVRVIWYYVPWWHHVRL